MQAKTLQFMSDKKRAHTRAEASEKNNTSSCFVNNITNATIETKKKTNNDRLTSNQFNLISLFVG